MPQEEKMITTPPRDTSEEIALHDGMPIEVSWDGDGYEWIPVDTPVASDKL